MKKIIALLMAAIMVFALAACAKTPENTDDPAADENIPADSNDVAGELENVEDENVAENTGDFAGAPELDGEGEAVEAEGAAKVLADIWAAFPEDQKFAIAGGDMNNATMDAPGKYDITLTEDMDVALGLPASEAANIDDAASLVHMMNGNTFTGAAYHLTEGTDADTFANAIKANLADRQWMCGRPEVLMAIKYDGYVITAFGTKQNTDNFKTAALTLEGAEVIFEEEITE